MAQCFQPNMYFKMLSAICFTLDQSKILSSGKVLIEKKPEFPEYNGTTFITSLHWELLCYMGLRQDVVVIKISYFTTFTVQHFSPLTPNKRLLTFNEPLYKRA